MQRGGGDYFLVKFMGWDFVHVCKNEQGGFVRGGGGGGIMSVSRGGRGIKTIWRQDFDTIWRPILRQLGDTFLRQFGITFVRS